MSPSLATKTAMKVRRRSIHYTAPHISLLASALICVNGFCQCKDDIMLCTGPYRANFALRARKENCALPPPPPSNKGKIKRKK